MGSKSSGPAGACPGGGGPVPRGTRRREQIVAVAEAAFLRQGFVETTMRDVAAQAGASTETLYRHFRGKEGLFAEVLDNRCRELRERFEAGIQDSRPMDAILRELGVSLLGLVTGAEVCRLLHLVLTESPRDPQVGATFHALGPGRTLERLTGYLEAARGRGEFRGADPGLAASIFIGAVMGHVQLLRLVLQDAPPPTPGEIEARVDEVVAMFMARYGARDRRGRPGLRPGPAGA